MTLHCAIIDDEPLAAQLLESYAKRIPILKITGVYNSALTAMADLRLHSVDLLFLDIQMPELSGMELARLIPSETRIIFTTAYKQYAIDGYKVSAFDYLLKPVSFESFQATVERAAQLFFSKKQEETTHSDRFIFVKSDYKLIRVSLDDILYIEGLKDYVRLKLVNGNRIMSLISMKRMEELLPKNEFMRTHRSYIVHMTLVDTIEKQRILMRDEVIPISDNYKEDIMRFAELHTLT